MPNQRACIPCKVPAVHDYIVSKLRVHVPIANISASLSRDEVMLELGHKRAPGLTMVKTHVNSHMKKVATVPAPLPSFRGTDENGDTTDVATAIQRQALEQLNAGEMRLTAAHALRAQELLDRRAEKERDRELMVTLARVLTRRGSAPAGLIAAGEDLGGVIEGEVLVVEEA